MLRSLPVAVIVLVALFTATGCSQLHRPTTALKSASLGEVTADGVGIDFEVDVTNPNSAAIPLTRTGYSLSVGMAKVLDGTLDAKTSIPAKGTQRLKVPVHVTFEQMLDAQGAIRASGGDLPYKFAGELDFSGSAFGIALTVPFEYSGELPLKKILSDPGILLRNPQARELAKKVLGSAIGG